MAKDPAFLFYYQDFLVGVDHMTDEQIGQYMKCLCHQANRGSIRSNHMKNICKTHDNYMIVSEKFKEGENGDLVNQRLSNEVIKRKNYAESRRNNRSTVKTYVKHMEDENIGEDESGKKKKKLKKFDFEPIWAMYPNKLGKKEAFGYFNTTVKTDEDFAKIKKAVANYVAYIHANQVEAKYIKSGCNWFDDWESWVNYEGPKISPSLGRAETPYKHFKEQPKADQEKLRKMMRKTAEVLKG